MKILAVVAIVVLVGILDFSIAAERHTPSAREIMGQVRRISKMPRSRSSASPMARHARSLHHLESSIEKECQQNGGNEVYKRSEKRIDTAVEELEAQIDYEKLGHQFRHANLTKDYSPLVDYLCARKPAVLRFCNEIAEASSACFDPLDQQVVTLILNMTIGVAEYVCENSGEQVKSFFSDGGMECMTSSKDNFYNCTYVFLGDSAEENSSSSDNSLEDDCGSSLTRYETCIKDQFQSCDNPSHANFLIGLITRFVRPICGESEDSTLLSATENTL